jgi:hypothetical protein
MNKRSKSFFSNIFNPNSSYFALLVLMIIKFVLYSLAYLIFSAKIGYVLPTILILGLGLNILYYDNILTKSKWYEGIPLTIRPTLLQIMIYTTTLFYWSINNSFSQIGFVFLVTISLLLEAMAINHEMKPESSTAVESVLSLLLIFLINNFLSLVYALWHWPIASLLLILIFTNTLVAFIWLGNITGRAEPLSLVWALLMTQFFLVSHRWLMFYPITFYKQWLISQVALISVILAYSYGSIFIAMVRKKLTIKVLIEHTSLATLSYILVLALNNWYK